MCRFTFGNCWVSENSWNRMNAEYVWCVIFWVSKKVWQILTYDQIMSWFTCQSVYAKPLVTHTSIWIPKIMFPLSLATFFPRENSKIQIGLFVFLAGRQLEADRQEVGVVPYPRGDPQLSGGAFVLSCSYFQHTSLVAWPEGGGSKQTSTMWFRTSATICRNNDTSAIYGCGETGKLDGERAEGEGLRPQCPLGWGVSQVSFFVANCAVSTKNAPLYSPEKSREI